MKKRAQILRAQRIATCVICGKAIAMGNDEVKMYPPTQKNGVNAHLECYETAHTIEGWRLRGRTSFAITQNGVNVTDSKNTGKGVWHTMRIETKDRDTADYLGNNGFTTWSVGDTYIGQMRRNNDQQLTRIGKRIFLEYDFDRCLVNGIDCKCTDDIHNATLQEVQNQTENIEK